MGWVQSGSFGSARWTCHGQLLLFLFTEKYIGMQPWDLLAKFPLTKNKTFKLKTTSRNIWPFCCIWASHSLIHDVRPVKRLEHEWTHSHMRQKMSVAKKPALWPNEATLDFTVVVRLLFARQSTRNEPWALSSSCDPSLVQLQCILKANKTNSRVARSGSWWFLHTS